MARIIRYKTRLESDKQIILEKESSINKPELESTIRNPQDASNFANIYLHLNEESEEYFYMLCMNSRNKVTGVFEISHGTASSSIVGVREIFQKALLVNAVSIIVIHNHPSGDCTPSKEDIDVTDRLSKAGKLIGIRVLDHVIIGDDYYSLMEGGYMEVN